MQSQQKLKLRNYTYCNQADARWASVKVNGTKTIKQVGCTLCCMAMILNTSPDQLNEWLKLNRGYSGDNIIWSVFSKKNLDYQGKVSGGKILTSFDNQKILILKLTGHWVLMRGYQRVKDAITVYVYDPGHRNTTEINFNKINEAVVFEEL